jgi:6-phosphogluconolactonase
MVPLVISHKHKTVEIYLNAEELSKRARDLVLAGAEDAIKSRGIFSMALSGGKSPLRLYALLALEHYRAFWKYTDIFQVDERLVPQEHKDSNARLLKEKLLAYLPFPENHIHLIPTELTTIEECRKAYDRTLIKYFQLRKGDFPRFDLILLGLGDDGHTASLFPENRTLREKEKLVLSSFEHRAPHQRISLSLPVLNNARQVIFLASGGSKAPVIKSIIEDEHSMLPAAMVKPIGTPALFLVDREAAAELTVRGNAPGGNFSGGSSSEEKSPIF